MARQAVIVIHGIGEQRPMTTLRGFVKSLMKYEETLTQGTSRFWAAPDSINQTLDLMRLSAEAQTVEGKERLKTDFFEYYWAHSMRGHSYGHIFRWIKSLMRRFPRAATLRVKMFWILMWILALLIFFAFLIGVSYGYISYFDGSGLIGKLTNSIMLLAKNTWRTVYVIALIFGLILIFFNFVIINYAGDAARYLSRTPDNIAGRNEIIKNGVSLLKGIHASTKKYERIVVIGHSLGSVIAYDILRHYWNDVYKCFDPGIVKGTPFVEAVGQFSNRNDSLSEADMDALRRHQLSLNLALRENDLSWRITDLITMGSPLTHADFLLANTEEEFLDRKLDREIPTCPPKTTTRDSMVYTDSDTQKSYFHHSAPFALTRWANLFYPGDLIGGPVHRNFNNGIRDISILYAGGWWRRLKSKINPMSHNGYWENNFDHFEKSKARTSIETIYKLIYSD